jgi:excisionase family DNA binding protein
MTSSAPDVAMTAPVAGSDTSGHGSPAFSTKDWLTINEAADWLRISRKALYRVATSDKTFPAVKIAGKVRINHARLIRWLDRRHPSATRARTRSPKVADASNPINAGDGAVREPVYR